MKKFKFQITATLEDGTAVSFDGDFIAGTVVSAINADGSLTPLADGDYTMNDGTKFSVKTGMIDVIAEDLAVVEPEAETPAVAEQENVDLTAIQNAIQELSDLIKGLQTTQAEMKAEFEAEKNQVNEKFSAVSTISVTEKEPEIKVEKSYPEQIMDRIRILKG